jgi:hypothetical protein
MEREFELGNDPEVAAAASNRPEQVIVLTRTRSNFLAVCHDQLYRD